MPPNPERPERRKIQSVLPSISPDLRRARRQSSPGPRGWRSGPGPKGTMSWALTEGFRVYKLGLIGFRIKGGDRKGVEGWESEQGTAMLRQLRLKARPALNFRRPSTSGITPTTTELRLQEPKAFPFGCFRMLKGVYMRLWWSDRYISLGFPRYGDPKPDALPP